MGCVYLVVVAVNFVVSFPVVVVIILVVVVVVVL
jgi:hypothetical protein